MRKYTLENYEDQLNHQVIHMDQAVCYCPEFRASEMMRDYPSRKLQLARAVFKGEMDVNDYIGDLVFQSILSRQGERWQNFGENPEDCTDVMILSREMLQKKGYVSRAVETFKSDLSAGNGHLVTADAWDLPQDAASDVAILLDDTSGAGFADDAESFKRYCEAEKIAFKNEATPVYMGFEYFAYGLIDEGIAHLTAIVEQFADLGVKKVMVVSPQAAYLLTTMAEKLTLELPFKVVYLPEILTPLTVEKPAYVYAGSFNLRYLCDADVLNNLLPNREEERIKTSIEFIPLLKGDQRVNQLTIWQRPIGAEYQLYGMDEDMVNAIRTEAIDDIKKANADTIIVFEPSAYPVLKETFTDKHVVSYLGLL